MGEVVRGRTPGPGERGMGWMKEDVGMTDICTVGVRVGGGG